MLPPGGCPRILQPLHQPQTLECHCCCRCCCCNHKNMSWQLKSWQLNGRQPPPHTHTYTPHTISLIVVCTLSPAAAAAAIPFELQLHVEESLADSAIFNTPTRQPSSVLSPLLLLLHTSTICRGNSSPPRPRPNTPAYNSIDCCPHPLPRCCCCRYTP